VSSISRIAVSGAESVLASAQTPSASIAATDADQSAVVRLSGGGRFAISAVAMPADANAIAAVSPAGPPPTTATSTLVSSTISTR